MRNLVLGAMIALVPVIAMPSSASAVPVVYFGENLSPGGAVSGAPVTAHDAFVADLTGVGTETFEGSAGSETPLALSFPGSSGSITATLAGSGGVCDTSSGTVGGIGCNGFGRFPTSGISWFHTTAPGFSVSFSDPIAAFGFYGTDVGDFEGQLTVTALDGIVSTFTIPSTIGAPDGSLLFWGFIDPTNAYTSLTFGATSGTGDVFGFDDLIVGDLEQVSIPEPSTLLLIGSGLLALTVAAGRRRKIRK